MRVLFNGCRRTKRRRTRTPTLSLSTWRGAKKNTADTFALACDDTYQGGKRMRRISRILHVVYLCIVAASFAATMATAACWVMSWGRVGAIVFCNEQAVEVMRHPDGSRPEMKDVDFHGIIYSDGGIWIGKSDPMWLYGLASGHSLRWYRSAEDIPVGYRFPFDRIHGGWSFGMLEREQNMLHMQFGAFSGIVIPLWFPFLIFSSLPISYLAMRFLRNSRMRNRIRHGLCLNCGYDLRATPDRCPECGTIPEKRDPNAPRINQ